MSDSKVGAEWKCSGVLRTEGGPRPSCEPSGLPGAPHPRAGHFGTGRWDAAAEQTQAVANAHF